MLINFTAGFLLVLLVFILDQGIDNTASISQNLRFVFRCIPSFCLGDGIVNLALLQLQQSVGGSISPWDMQVCGWDIVYLAATFPMYLAAMLVLDGGLADMMVGFSPFKTAVAPEQPNQHCAPTTCRRDEDEFVAQEREEVENAEEHERKDDAILVRNLNKVYPDGHVAVRDVTFGVHPREIFCLLGVNGAGKTSTLSILSQKIKPTSGSVTIDGIDILTRGTDALRVVGYCPQFDAVFDLLTVDEHLELFGKIRGLCASGLSMTVSYLANFCHLSGYRKTLAMNLSGGNRRKLSLALALIGSPKVVFLDEPSAGMDPVARREMWNVIHVVAMHSAVVLTTHHLEEVEALAHRVAILASGSLLRIGDKLSLKKRFGAGFELSVCLHSADTSEIFDDFVLATAPHSAASEIRGPRYVLSLPQEVQLSEIFAKMEENKERLGVAYYSLSQTSIEQVLLRTARVEQAEEPTVVPTMSPLHRRLASFQRRNPKVVVDT